MARISQENVREHLIYGSKMSPSKILLIRCLYPNLVFQKYKSSFPTQDNAKSGWPKKLSNREVRRLVILSKKTPTATASELRQTEAIENKVSVDTDKES